MTDRQPLAVCVPGDVSLPAVARLSRRSVLNGAVAGGMSALAVSALPPIGALAQRSGAAEIIPVADNLSIVAGVGGNVLVRSGADSQLVVDSGARDSIDALRDALAALPGDGRVGKLFNTHWHPEQTGSNAALGRAGAAIVAHEKTRLHLSVDYYDPVEDSYVPALPQEAWPTESFYTTGSTTFDGEQIDYGHLLEAHTDGDAYVYFRDSNVVAVGDVLSPSRDPVLDWFGGGWLGGRADSLALLLELTDERTRFVPSYGPVVGRDYLQAEHELMVTLYDRVQEHVRKGMSATDIFEAGVMDDLGRRFDDPRRFLYDAHKGMWAHHNTLSHDIV